MHSVMDFDPKGTISEVRVHGGAKLGHAGRWSIVKCRLSTKESFDHHNKVEDENVKKWFRKMKKPEHPRRSVRKYDEYVIDYACENGCVKVENVKTAKTRLKVYQGVFPSECTQEHTACTDLLCRSGEGRGRLIIVCGAPRSTA